ncbi:MAG: hypothetical protein AABY65_12510 [Nitrospirota bacterium]|jgi:hypothetical protein
MPAIPSSMRGRLERVFVIVMAVFSSLVPHPSRDLVPVRVRARSISPLRGPMTLRRHRGRVR